MPADPRREALKSAVLLVDDDISILETVERILSPYYEVRLAKSGEAALRAAADAAPDIVLLDISMPEMDGYETLERLRASPSFEETPVIFLTGLTDARDQARGLSSGADDYITKPFEKDVLLARLRLRLKAGMERRKQREAMRNGRLVELDEKYLDSLARKLTGVEHTIARLIVAGCSYQEIAENLSYSVSYVRKRAVGVFDKMGVDSKIQLRKALIKDSAGE